MLHLRFFERKNKNPGLGIPEKSNSKATSEYSSHCQTALLYKPKKPPQFWGRRSLAVGRRSLKEF